MVSVEQGITRWLHEVGEEVPEHFLDVAARYDCSVPGSGELVEIVQEMLDEGILEAALRGGFGSELPARVRLTSTGLRIFRRYDGNPETW